jgi:methionine-gamma-lyase
MKFASLCAHERRLQDNIRPNQLPLYATSTFTFEDIQEGIDTFQGKTNQHFYSRYGNPTVEAVAAKLADMEAYETGFEAHAIMTSSGMAAISTLMMSCLKAGDKVLTQGNLYGGPTELFLKVLEPLGISTVFANLKDMTAVDAALQADSAIKMVYFETPANPTMDCVDIAAICAVAKAHGCMTVADNTFCTPYIQQPLRHGCDFVIHSTTKYLNGHGNSIAGVIIGKDVDFMKKKVWQTMKLIGTNCSPFEAWYVKRTAACLLAAWVQRSG